MESCDENNLDSGCRIDIHLVFDSIDFMCKHCTGRNTCLIWSDMPGWSDMGWYESEFSVVIFSICLLIVGPMFLYGIFKSFSLSKMLKSQSELPQQLPLTEL